MIIEEFWATLLCFSSMGFAGIRVGTALLRAHHLISGRLTLTGHYNTFFSFPAVLFVLVLEIFLLLHDPVLGFSCLTDDPPFDSRIL